MKYFLIAALVMVAGWYQLDGRYIYKNDGQYSHRIDRITGERCQAGGGPAGWYGCQ